MDESCVTDERPCHKLKTVYISSCIFFSMVFWASVFKEEWGRFGTSLQCSFGDRDNESEQIIRWTSDLRNTWKEVLQLRLEPDHVIAGCNTTWLESDAIPWRQKADRTSELNSFILDWDIKPAGEFSRILLQSMYTNNTLKTIGGDLWRVRVTGNISVPVSKSDLGNGSYEFRFLTLFSGYYTLDVTLEYTLCDGVKDPPPNWFIKGNKHGKQQEQGSLLKDNPYIDKPLWGGYPVILYIPSSRLSVGNKTIPPGDICNIAPTNCNYLSNDYGSWINTTWVPFCPGVNARYPRKHQGILWIFGDSVSFSWFHDIQNSRLCKEIFTTCMYTYGWVYSLENYNLSTKSYSNLNRTIEKATYDGLDVNITKIMEDLKQAVLHPQMDENSVILFNYGLHFTQAVSYMKFQDIIKAIIFLRKNERIRCRMIWRTITSIDQHKFQHHYMHQTRFITPQRVMLYNAYATRAFCKDHFEVLDIYQLTDSYPYGTGSNTSTNPHITPHDAVHYESHVMKYLETMLGDIFAPIRE